MKLDDWPGSGRKTLLQPREVPDDGERFHDEWWLPRSDRAKAAMAEALRLVANVADATRTRARRALDQRRFENQVTAYVCDLWRRHGSGAGSTVAVSRAKRTLDASKGRYAHPDMTGTAVLVQDALMACGLCRGRKGHWGGSQGEGRRSTLAPTRRLLDLLPAPTHNDFTRELGEEVILLRGDKDDLTNDGYARERSGPLLDYADTADTDAMRDELRRINAHLVEANITLDDGVLASFTTERFDPGSRRLYRIFANGRFDTGGRLYRGFWIGLPKVSRHEVLQIDDEPVVMLDYGQMSTRLAYAKVGITPPSGDLYETGKLALWKRDGVKKLINAALFSSVPLTRRPKGSAKMLPRGDFSNIMRALRDAHGPIAHLFESGEGLRIQRTESDIMVQVLLRLIDIGVTALPIHDAIVVGELHASQAEAVMRGVFYEHSGAEGTVSSS
jgi:hypothetical protein